MSSERESVSRNDKYWKRGRGLFRKERNYTWAYRSSGSHPVMQPTVSASVSLPSEGRPQCKGKVVVGGDWYILYSVTWVRCGQQALITRRVRLRPLQRVLRVCVFRGAPNKPGEGGGGVGSRVVGWRGKNRNKKKRREKENGIQEEE